jgi:hypothetical protein
VYTDKHLFFGGKKNEGGSCGGLKEMKGRFEALGRWVKCKLTLVTTNSSEVRRW